MLTFAITVEHSPIFKLWVRFYVYNNEINKLYNYTLLMMKHSKVYSCSYNITYIRSCIHIHTVIVIVSSHSSWYWLTTLYTVYTLHIIYTQYTVHCIYTAHYIYNTLYTIHCTLYTVHYTLYIIHCTLYTVHYTLYTIHCTLYTTHCTL